MMAERRLLEPIAHELQRNAEARLWRSLGALDAYRQRFEDIPDTLTNAILLGSLLFRWGTRCGTCCQSRHGGGAQERAASRDRDAAAGAARRRTLRQILALQQRLMDMNLSPRAKRALMHRGPFREA
jgi:hypothetical protein